LEDTESSWLRAVNALPSIVRFVVAGFLSQNPARMAAIPAEKAFPPAPLGHFALPNATPVVVRVRIGLFEPVPGNRVEMR